MVNWELRQYHRQHTRDLPSHNLSTCYPSKVSKAEPAQAAKFHHDAEPQELEEQNKPKQEHLLSSAAFPFYTECEVYGLEHTCETTWVRCPG